MQHGQVVLAGDVAILGEGKVVAVEISLLTVGSIVFGGVLADVPLLDVSLKCKFPVAEELEKQI